MDGSLKIMISRRLALPAAVVAAGLVMGSWGLPGACAAARFPNIQPSPPHTSRKAAQDLLQAAELQADPVLAARAAILAYRRAHYHLARDAILFWQTLSPGDNQGDNLLILVDLETGHIHEALVVLTALVRNLAHPHRVIGALLQLVGPRVPQADLFALAQNWVREVPADPIAHWALAEVAAREHIVGLAVREFHWILVHDPDSTRARLALAKAWVMLGDVHRSQMLIAPLKANARKLSPAFTLALANIDLLSGDLKGASRLDRVLIVHKPPVPGAFLGLSWIALREHKNRVAETSLTRLLETNTANRTAAYFLGLAYESEKHPMRAMAWYRFSAAGAHFLPATLAMASIEIQKDPSAPAPAMATIHTAMRLAPVWAPRLTLGAVALLVRTGHLQKAVGFLAKARKRWKQDPDLAYAQALLDIRVGHRLRATRTLNALVLHHSRDPLFLNALGYTWTVLGQHLHHARSLIRKALDEDPEDPALLDSLGWAEFKLKHWSAAYRHLRLAHHLSPGQTTIAFHWGRMLWQIGHYRAARRIWTAALRKVPADARIRKALSWHPVHS